MKEGVENNKPLFSVVIPIYNAEKVLERTIQSVLSQTYKRFELLLVDDCSTDNSFRIAQEYERKAPQVHAIQLPVNSGSAQKPIATGFDVAKGDFVIVIGNDDEINEIFLSQIYATLQDKSDIDIVVPVVRVVDSLTNELTGSYPNKGFDMSSILTGPEACKKVMPQWQFATNGMAVRKKMFDHVKDENPYTFSNSDEFTSRILLYHAHKVAFSKDSEYTYFQYSTSITHKCSVKLFETLYTDTHLISFSEKYFDTKLTSEMCVKMLSNMKGLYRAYRLSQYTTEEKQKIATIFRETYAFLKSKKKYLPDIRHQLYLSNWCVFTWLCVLMYQKRLIQQSKK